ALPWPHNDLATRCSPPRQHGAAGASGGCPRYGPAGRPHRPAGFAIRQLGRCGPAPPARGPPAEATALPLAPPDADSRLAERIEAQVDRRLDRFLRRALQPMQPTALL